ncbi:hypothetical protein Lal_00021457 [Lupinus albus]|nr:hypothetical protein Lal_00021457 [Lupinus albus]
MFFKRHEPDLFRLNRLLEKPKSDIKAKAPDQDAPDRVSEAKAHRTSDRDSCGLFGRAIHGSSDLGHGPFEQATHLYMQHISQMCGLAMTTSPGSNLASL